MEPKIKLLIVDDQEEILEKLSILLKENFDIYLAHNGGEAISAFKEKHFEIVLADVRMPGIDGIQLLTTIKKMSPSCEVILMTGYLDLDMVLKALKEKAFALITKPLDIEETLSRIEQARAFILSHKLKDKVFEEMKSEIFMQTLFTQRLSALSSISGGIAHEFSQPLSVIGLNAETLKTMVEKGREIPPGYLLQNTVITLEQVDRAVGILEHMKEFSYGSEGYEPVDFDLGETIHRVKEIVGAQLKAHGIALLVDSPDGIRVRASRNRLEQTLLSLISNSKDSILDNPSTADHKNGKKEIRIKAFNREPWIMLDIIDTGAGVPGKVRENLFDPFVTGKKTGTGGGLGLSICQRILNDYGSTIELLNTGPGGTTFRIKFPAME